MTWWDSFIEADLQLLWEIQDWVYRRPWLDSRMARIVSKHPWQDICAVPWLLCALGVYELGFRHFWVVGVNLAGAYVLRQAVQGKRPLEYDSRLQPMTDLHADSFGLPSLETHMSTVILLHFALTLAARAGGGLLMHVATLVPALLLCALVGFSRVYARSRFPHQVALSWLSGAVGLALGGLCCDGLRFHKMHWYHHNVCVAVAGLSVAAAFAMAIENNDSRLVYIPKKEFIRVMAGIINSSSDGPQENRAEYLQDQQQQQQGEGGDDDLPAFQDASDRGGTGPGGATGAGARVAMTPRAAAARRARLPAPQMPLRRAKRDSFHFLQRSIEERERRLRGGGGGAGFGFEEEEEHVA